MDPQSYALMPRRLTRFLKPAKNKVLQSIITDFVKSRSANVGVLFGLVMLPIMTVVGISVDFSYATKARNAIQNALDSSILAAARELQTTGSSEKAINIAQKNFNTYTGNQSFVANLNVTTIDPGSGTLDFEASGTVGTAFTSIIGVDTINVSAKSSAELAMGGEGQKNIEISMMLDVTGSMSGSKIADLKLAAKDLVQIVLQGNQADQITTRVALVPFSDSVNVHDYAAQVVGDVPATIPYGNKTYKLAEQCVSERTGPEAFTDAAPENGNYVGPVYTKNGKCKPRKDKLVPLSSDKDLLDEAIEDLKTTGYTAGHLGTMWAWYTLSPNWNSVWPEESHAASYENENYQKIAILMTDGSYNYVYDSDGVAYYNTTVSDDKAEAVCTNMKAAGVTVYTVGFKLDNSAKEIMEFCATSEDHYFLAENGEELRATFREIAFQIAQLRLTK